MKTCSGGILGMGESDDDVIDLALSLRELDVKSVPVNFLIPVPGTSFANVRELDPRRCLRILCLYRFLLPTQEIRVSGGREVHPRRLRLDARGRPRVRARFSVRHVPRRRTSGR